MRNNNALERRKGVLSRLKRQLKDGTKPNRIERFGKVRTTDERVALTELDIKRIEKEIETLESRI